MDIVGDKILTMINKRGKYETNQKAKLNKITVCRGQEHIGEALRYIPRSSRERNGNEVVFYKRDDMIKFYAKLRLIREDKPDNRKMKAFHFGSYK